MELTKRNLGAIKGFSDLKLQALEDSSAEDKVKAGLTYAKEQLALLTESQLSLSTKTRSVLKEGNYKLAKKLGNRFIEGLEREKYYLGQGNRLLKILSKKSGKPVVIIKSITESSIYDPGRFVSNKERQILENGTTNMLKKRAEEAIRDNGPEFI